MLLAAPGLPLARFCCSRLLAKADAVADAVIDGVAAVPALIDILQWG